MAFDKESGVSQAQPAARGYARYFDMPFGGNSPEPHVPKLVAIVAIGILRAVFKVLFRFRVDGREKLYALKDRTGVVVVCNHTSFLDVIFAYFGVRPRMWPRFMARDTLFTETPRLFGWFLARVGVFPVRRDAADRTSLKRAASMLKNNEVVCILPEGTRRGKGSKAPSVHGGAALIARMGRAPIVPMTVRDAEHIKQKGKPLRFPKVTVEFGDPILVSDFDFLPKADRLEGCVWYALRECFALSQRTSAAAVDMAALFPDGRDFTDVFEQRPITRHTSEELARAIEGKK